MKCILIITAFIIIQSLGTPYIYVKYVKKNACLLFY